VVLSSEDVTALRTRMDRDGVVHVPSAKTQCRPEAERLASSVQLLRDAGWYCVFPSFACPTLKHHLRRMNE
jgi:hypothetical protein